MSLINDALKRARLEAARQDRDRAAAAIPSAPSHVPQRRSLARPVALLLVLLAAAVVVFALSRSGAPLVSLTPAPPLGTTLGDRPEPVPSVDDGPGPTPLEKQTTAAAASPASPEPAGGTPPSERRSSATAQPPALAATTTGPTLDPGPRAVAPDAAPPPATTPQVGPPPELDGGSFVRSVQIPGGVLLELQGIAWSDTHPVALINGNAIAVGEGLAGFLVQYIDRDRVELRGGEASFELRLR